MKIEGMIAFICLFIFLFSKQDIELLKCAGIFSIASYVGQLVDKLEGGDENEKNGDAK